MPGSEVRAGAQGLVEELTAANLDLATIYVRKSAYDELTTEEAKLHAAAAGWRKMAEADAAANLELKLEIARLKLELARSA